jgi:beta-glucanase (GH16 family)
MPSCVRVAVLSGALLSASVSPSPAAQLPHHGDASTPGSWALTFEDDFNGSALNSSVWNVRNNQTHCEPCEPQLYIPSAVTVEDGSLVLTTSRASAIGPGGELFNFTSGWVDSKNSFAQKFGLFETRARLPPQNATGIWPAFWTLPNNNSACWPVGGEIDVFEYTANPLDNAIFGSYRWGTSCGNNQQVLPGAAYPPFGQPAIDWSADFHVFATQWNASALTFFVDGVPYETKTAAEVNLPADPQYLIFDAAVAWYFMPGPDAVYPARTLFDWVRVYEWQADAQ